MRQLKNMAALATAIGALSGMAAQVESVIVRQQWPWSTDVKVEYNLTGVTDPVDLKVSAWAGSVKLDDTLVASAVKGNVEFIDASGIGSFYLDPKVIFGSTTVSVPDFKVKLEPTPAKLYVVVDLTQKNTVSYYASSNTVPGGVNSDTYKGDKLILKRIFAVGKSFKMGSGNSDIVHTVSFTNDFYIGVFPITQKQWKTIYGSCYASFADYEDSWKRPVNHVGFYYMIRGEDSEWPDKGHSIPSNRFLGKLIAHAGIDFDLPTDAQWEYAYRAGTTTAYYNGLGETSKGAGNDAAMEEIGWYSGNSAVDAVAQTHAVGLKTPNAWGLYDMAGNVWEWCLDWFNYGKLPDAVEPEGVAKADAYNKLRVIRGGSYDKPSSDASAYRRWYWSFNVNDGGSLDYLGFRVMAPAKLHW